MYHLNTSKSNFGEVIRWSSWVALSSKLLQRRKRTKGSSKKGCQKSIWEKWKSQLIPNKASIIMKTLREYKKVKSFWKEIGTMGMPQLMVTIGDLAIRTLNWRELKMVPVPMKFSPLNNLIQFSCKICKIKSSLSRVNNWRKKSLKNRWGMSKCVTSVWGLGQYSSRRQTIWSRDFQRDFYHPC